MNASRPLVRGLALIAGALGAVLLAVLLVLSRFEGGRPRSVILLVACLSAAVGLSVLGARALRRRGVEPGPGVADYRHMTPLFGGTVAAMALLGVALDALVPASYGLLGPFRAQALAAAAVGEPRHLGEPSCIDCHAEQVALHDKDAHARVPCESCHGPGREHVAFRKAAVGRGTDEAESAVPEGARMLVRKQREWCLRCHEADPARPGAFPQIVWTEHMLVSGIAGPGAPATPGGSAPSGDVTPVGASSALPCGSCHDPHEPLFMDRDLREARLHPIVHRCEDCHGRTSPVFVAAGTPDKHPVTFQCGYCHGTVADEFTRSPHKSLDCTTCHVFFAESSFAGRIIRDADPRFCLLCHERTDYRRPDGPKTIKWPSHRDAMRRDAKDERQRCIECHRSALHYPPPPAAEVDVDDLFGDEPDTPEKPATPNDKGGPP